MSGAVGFGPSALSTVRAVVLALLGPLAGGG